ncbi:MAG: hypothetical protein JCHSAcid_05490 [uncultured Acidilobus sp. JCHS]|nr:MAG: hypothetical protein JCHSAcid_05490 [uncultured Acidilobus sp. JCHS]
MTSLVSAALLTITALTLSTLESDEREQMTRRSDVVLHETTLTNLLPRASS